MTTMRRLGRWWGVPLLLLLLLLVAAEWGTVWLGEKKLAGLCARRQLPVVYDRGRWANWSRVVRQSSTRAGINDPMERQKLVALTKRNDIGFRWIGGFPFGFPFQTVWIGRTELFQSNQKIASFDDLYASRSGPISSLLTGREIGAKTSCEDKSEERKISDLMAHEFVAASGVQSQSFDWKGRRL